MNELMITDVKVPFWSVLVLVFKFTIASVLVSAAFGGLALVFIAVSGFFIHSMGG